MFQFKEWIIIAFVSDIQDLLINHASSCNILPQGFYATEFKTRYSWPLVQGVEKSRIHWECIQLPEQTLSSSTTSASIKRSFNTISVQISPNVPSIYSFLNPIWTNSFIMPSINFAIYTKGYHLVNHSYTGEILSFSSIHIQKVHDWAARQLFGGRIIKGTSYLESVKIIL